MEISTSDRVLFKRCRRRWHWQSPMRLGLQPTGAADINLFIGTGIHFALEDYHGHRHYGSLEDAFDAYRSVHTVDELPSEWWDEEHLVTAHGMLAYYREWEQSHFGARLAQMYSEKGKQPLVEVRFKVPFKRFSHVKGNMKIARLAYTGVFDRIVKDEYDRLWVIDYKTAGRFDTSRVDTDPQITAYTLMASKIFGVKFEGIIWVQMLKDYPQFPRQLKNGELSKAKDQRTTYALYQQALLKQYGRLPEEYHEVLNHLASQEGAWGDKFIRFDMVSRNEHQLKMEERKIKQEAREMIDLKLPNYPNPTRDCAWDCPFRSPCITLDDGYDYAFILKENYRTAPTREERDFWRERLEYPHAPIYME